MKNRIWHDFFERKTVLFSFLVFAFVFLLSGCENYNFSISNDELNNVIRQVLARDEAKMWRLYNEKKLVLYRYAELVLPGRNTEKIDLCTVLEDKKNIICSTNYDECDVYILKIYVKDGKRLGVKVITNTPVVFNFRRKNKKWELYQIITRIIMDSPIIKVKRKGKWHILTSKEVRDFLEKSKNEN